MVGYAGNRSLQDDADLATRSVRFSTKNVRRYAVLSESGSTKARPIISARRSTGSSISALGVRHEPARGDRNSLPMPTNCLRQTGQSP